MTYPPQAQNLSVNPQIQSPFPFHQDYQPTHSQTYYPMSENIYNQVF